MQLSDLIKEFFSLTWSKANTANVVDTLTMLIKVIVTKV